MGEDVEVGLEEVPIRGRDREGHTQLQQATSRIQALDAEVGALRTKRDVTAIGRQEVDQHVIHFIPTLSGSSVDMVNALLRVGRREQYYRDLYELEVPLEWKAPSASVALSNGRLHSRRSHSKSQSSGKVSGPTRKRPYDRQPSKDRSSGSPQQSPQRSPRWDEGSFGQRIF